MKYIKGFNEGRYQAKKGTSGIVEFCESYLASILDTNRYTIKYIGSKADKSIEITIKNIGKQALGWDDFKLDFLPFLEMLMREYTVVSSGHKLGNSIVNINGRFFTKEEMEDDNFSFSLIKRLGDWSNHIDYVKIMVK